MPQSMWYKDGDGDGYGLTASTTLDCAEPPGYAAVGDDCNDSDANIHPDALEICDDVDNNCDGDADEGLVQVAFLVDADGDGFGTPGPLDCAPPSARVDVRGDCDDGSPFVHPGADDPEGDGVDQDCGGTGGC